MSRIVLVAVFSAVAFPLLAQSRLVGVTGDGASVPSSLYFLDPADASSTFIMSLGAGNDGETIGYNPVDNLLYHASGYFSGFHAWDSIDVDTATIVTAGTRTGDVPGSEFLAMTYDPASGTFLTAGLLGDFQSTTLGGVATQLGTTDAAVT
jgi:hypothetical protein